MENVLYRRQINHQTPPNRPTFAQAVILTEEVNGFALFVESYIDGSEEDPLDVKYFYRGKESWRRRDAIEAAVDLARGIEERSRNAEYVV